MRKLRDFLTPRPIVAFDFDGTIKPNNKLSDFSEPPHPVCIRLIKKLYELGCPLVLWTSRYDETLQLAKDYLEKHGILHCFVAFNENIPDLWFKTSAKIFANYYVDDLGILGIPEWEEIEAIILGDIEEANRLGIKDERRDRIND